ncbi:hypothetical protein Bbelb_212540, partial [Branchiostoma belcheri]
ISVHVFLGSPLAFGDPDFLRSSHDAVYGIFVVAYHPNKPSLTNRAPGGRPAPKLPPPTPYSWEAVDQSGVCVVQALPVTSCASVANGQADPFKSEEERNTASDDTLALLYFRSERKFALNFGTKFSYSSSSRLLPPSYKGSTTISIG